GVALRIRHARYSLTKTNLQEIDRMLRPLARWLAVVAWAGVLAACSSNGRPVTPPASPPGSPAATAPAAKSAPPGLVAACPSAFGVRARPVWLAASHRVLVYGLR